MRVLELHRRVLRGQPPPYRAAVAAAAPVRPAPAGEVVRQPRAGEEHLPVPVGPVPEQGHAVVRHDAAPHRPNSRLLAVLLSLASIIQYLSHLLRQHVVAPDERVGEGRVLRVGHAVEEHYDPLPRQEPPQRRRDEGRLRFRVEVRVEPVHEARPRRRRRGGVGRGRGGGYGRCRGGAGEDPVRVGSEGGHAPPSSRGLGSPPPARQGRGRGCTSANAVVVTGPVPLDQQPLPLLVAHARTVSRDRSVRCPRCRPSPARARLPPAGASDAVAGPPLLGLLRTQNGRLGALHGRLDRTRGRLGEAAHRAGERRPAVLGRRRRGRGRGRWCGGRGRGSVQSGRRRGTEGTGVLEGVEELVPRGGARSRSGARLPAGSRGRDGGAVVDRATVRTWRGTVRGRRPPRRRPVLGHGGRRRARLGYPRPVLGPRVNCGPAGQHSSRLGVRAVLPAPRIRVEVDPLHPERRVEVQVVQVVAAVVAVDGEVVEEPVSVGVVEVRAEVGPAEVVEHGHRLG